MWLIIVVAAVRLSNWANYWRNTGLYCRELANQNEKSFQVLLSMQNNGIFVARKISGPPKQGAEPNSIIDIET